MKNYFKIGLMALSLAFGVTSCDKQDSLGGGSVNALSPEAQLAKSEVSFGLEDMGIDLPKGYKSLTAKDQSEFDHIYATTSNTLVISDGTPTTVWTGEYLPNNTSTLIGTNGYEIPIHLNDNVDFNVVVDNVGNAGTGLVLGYLPYTASASFVLPRTESIQLDAVLLRGFLIINAEDAESGNRVTGVTVSAGDGSAALLDDGTDFYGYLETGDYDVVVSYDLDGNSRSITASQTITNGFGYTIELTLDAEYPDTLSDFSEWGPLTAESSVATITQTRTRIVVQNGALDAVAPVGDLTETRPFANPDYVSGSAVPGFTDDATPGTPSAFVARVYSAYAPAFTDQIAGFDQTRTVTNADASADFDPTIAEEALTLSVTVSSTGGVESTETGIESGLNTPRSINSDGDLLDTLTRTVTSDTVYTSSIGGTHTVETANGEWSIVVDNTAEVVNGLDTGVWELNADGDAAIFVITLVNAEDETPLVPSAAPADTLLDEGTRYVAGDAFADGTVAIELIPTVAATWVDGGNNIIINSVEYDIFTKTGETLKYVIDQDLFTPTLWGYIILNADNTVHTSSLGSTSSDALATAAAQAAIDLL